MRSQPLVALPLPWHHFSGWNWVSALIAQTRKRGCADSLRWHADLVWAVVKPWGVVDWKALEGWKVAPVLSQETTFRERGTGKSLSSNESKVAPARCWLETWEFLEQSLCSLSTCVFSIHIFSSRFIHLSLPWSQTWGLGSGWSQVCLKTPFLGAVGLLGITVRLEFMTSHLHPFIHPPGCWSPLLLPRISIITFINDDYDHDSLHFPFLATIPSSLLLSSLHRERKQGLEWLHDLAKVTQLVSHTEPEFKQVKSPEPTLLPWAGIAYWWQSGFSLFSYPFPKKALLNYNWYIFKYTIWWVLTYVYSHETVAEIKIMNKSITPQSFLVHPSFPPLLPAPRQPMICFLSL